MALTRVSGNLIASTAVTAGIYGGSGNTVNITVDSQGRVTAAANVASAGASAATPIAEGTVYGKMTSGGGTPFITALGYNAAAAMTTGTRTVAVGREALMLNTSGDRNHAFGMGALASNLIGSNNTAIGYTALNASTANNNTAVGYQALVSNTSADNNTAVGYQAGYTSTVAADIVAIGYQALNKTTADNNVAVGSGAGYNTAGGGNNTFMGYQSGYGNTTASFNSAYGLRSFFTNTTGQYNTALGYNALYSNTTASYNTAVGYQAGYTNVTGATVTYLGYQAGYTATGGHNTFVGTQAGYAVTTGAKNTILGRYDGNQGGLDIRTSSNHIVLSDGDGNPRTYFDNNGSFYVNQFGALAGYSEQAIITSTSNTVTLALKTHTTNIALGCTNTDTSTYVAASFCNNGNFSGATKGSISVSNTGTTYNTTSDYRLKEDVQPMGGALAKVAALKPVTYKWKNDGSNGEGFIAHELAEVCPHAVTGEKDATEIYTDEEGNEQTRPKYQGVDTSFLVATLTAAIQELKAELDAYKSTHP